VAGPAYYRPVVFGGKAFPVARSNFLSLLRFRNDWHAPRLRLVGGMWRLVGLHEGIDIAAESGTPVLSMTAGTVENAGWTFYSGTRVGVRGADGRYYLYAHLSALGRGIVPGARVVAGDLLGRVGNTGYGDPGHRDEFPPHLHFGVQAGSVWVSPFRTLVDLYRATVARNRLDQASLDELARSGEPAAWRQATAELFADFTLVFGE
jgi:murein DD-endopeptidase MepM/ murein hydrolase activator NlpD